MFIWLGDKEFIPGVPPRDMTVEEVERKGLREIVELSPLYKFISPPTGEDEEE